ARSNTSGSCGNAAGLALAVVYQPGLHVVTWKAGCQYQLLTFIDAANLVTRRLESDTAIKNVDIALIMQSFLGQHGQCRFRIGVHARDGVACFRAEETGIKREFWHHLGNERLAADA